jgi:hypothetical protein
MLFTQTQLTGWDGIEPWGVILPQHIILELRGSLPIVIFELIFETNHYNYDYDLAC